VIKKLFSFSSFVILTFVLVFQSSITSCKKTETIIKTVVDTITVTKTDTLQEKDTALTKAILTANPWRIQELRALFGSDYIYYLRGGSNNTQSFDNEYITFNSDNTGIYVNDAGAQTSLTWNFSDPTNRKLVWIWNLPTPVTVTWENITYDDGAIRYTEYFTQNGISVLSSGVRIPK
jgi:hypothetical protein